MDHIGIESRKYHRVVNPSSIAGFQLPRGSCYSSSSGAGGTLPGCMAHTSVCCAWITASSESTTLHQMHPVPTHRVSRTADLDYSFINHGLLQQGKNQLH